MSDEQQSTLSTDQQTQAPPAPEITDYGSEEALEKIAAAKEKEKAVEPETPQSDKVPESTIESSETEEQITKSLSKTPFRTRDKLRDGYVNICIAKVNAMPPAINLPKLSGDL